MSGGRVRELYAEGGVRAVLAGMRRELRWRRSRAAVWVLARTRDPPRALRRYLALRRRLQPGRYTDADPLKRLWVPPDAIEAYSTDAPYYWGRVSGGDWERRPLAEHPVYRAVRRRFVDGCSWEEILRETDLRDDIEADPERIDRLYARIDEEGYRTQAQLLSEAPRETRRRNNDTPHPLLNEVGVCIDRDGEFVWRHVGQHRLAVATVLGVDELAVQVRGRHREWQRIRDEIRQAAHRDDLSDRASAALDHPDLDGLAGDL